MADVVIALSTWQLAGEDWVETADRWTAKFYLPGEPVFGTAVVTRFIPGVHPNPHTAYTKTDRGLLDVIPSVIFGNDGELTPVLRDTFGYDPALLLLLESVKVDPEWRGKGAGMDLAVTVLHRLVGGAPNAVAVTYPAPIHSHGPDEPCSYESDDPEVRRPDEIAYASLRKAWAKKGFVPLVKGVYALPL